MSQHFEPVTLSHGPAWPNRLALAPMTNSQSHADGTLSDDEYKWLTMRAEGGFGLTMTCASHVQRIGQGFPGQLGCWDDRHIPGLRRLADGIRAAGSVSSIQLHHAGLRSPKELIGEAPVGPSPDEATGTRELSTGEVQQLVEDFVRAAERAQEAGFDGVEIHGAHGYVVCAFLSPETNRRTDAYGDRPRLLMEIVEWVRRRCRPDFQLGVRISPERFGLDTREAVDLAARLLQDPRVDYLDVSMWDTFKEPEREDMKGQDLLSYFAELPRTGVLLGAAGKLRSGADVRRALDRGLDFATIGRSAILHHDFPRLLEAGPSFEPVPLPVTEEHLAQEGLGPAFIGYMKGWQGFVAQTVEA